jgi:hypothetical protein
MTNSNAYQLIDTLSPEARDFFSMIHKEGASFGVQIPSRWKWQQLAELKSKGFIYCHRDEDGTWVSFTRMGHAAASAIGTTEQGGDA